MEKQRSDDMISILQLNSSIDKLYKLLCELELKGEKDSEQYKEYVDIIRFASKRCERYMTKYNLGDSDINDFINLLGELNHYEKYDPMNYIDPVSNIKIKRFIQHNYELSLLYHETDEDMYYDDKVTIEGVEYDYETGAIVAEQEGYEEQAEDIRFLQKQKEQEIEQERKLDDMNYAELVLETHTFMLYLLDRIEEETNEEIKKKLIEAKYRIISNVRTLELSFLYDSSLDYSLFVYQDDLHRIFKSDPRLYVDYVMKLEQIIDWARMSIIERSKEKYDSIDDQIYNILLSISLKTYTSIIPNETVRNGIKEDSDAGVELAKGKIDKKVLKKSTILNKKYIIKEANNNR